MVVDEEIYRLLPALVIATVDKFAQMPWEGTAGAVRAGLALLRAPRLPDRPSEQHPGHSPQARGRCPRCSVLECEPLRPPDLIIQDELHLISGPLGSLVGLYETAVDALCSLDGRRAAGAAEGDRVDRDDPPRRRSGDAALRSRAGGVPAAGARRA